MVYSSAFSIISISSFTGTILIIVCVIYKIVLRRAKSPIAASPIKISFRRPRFDGDRDDDYEYDDIVSDGGGGGGGDGNSAQTPHRLRHGFSSFGFDDGSVAAGPEICLDPALAEDSKLIGGSPKHLPPPRGPTGTTLTFRVYAPPALDKEIPKVDLVGAIDFLKTGKVRTFVPLGAKRLLMINFRDMTLELYMPKQGKNKQRRAKELQQPATFLSDVSTRTINTHDNIRYENYGLKSSGINISTKRLAPMKRLGTKLEESEGDSDWDRCCFERNPSICHPLNELISVSALPPSYSGAIEIVYRGGHSGMKGNSAAKSSNQKPKQEKSQQAVPIKQPKLKKGEISMKNIRSITRMNSKGSSYNDSDYSAQSETDQIEKWLGDVEMDNSRGHVQQQKSKNPNCVSSVSYPDDDDGRIDYAEPTVLADDGFAACAVGLTDQISSRNLPSRPPSATPTLANSLDNDENLKENDTSLAYSMEEFVFCNPRDAAEFQRVVLALRTSGREITHLYETLEAIQATSAAHFPELLNPVEEMERRKKAKQAQQDHKRKKSATHIPKLVPAGVALDDIWRCLGDLPLIRQGLTRLHTYSKSKIGNEDDIIAEAGGSNPYNYDEPAAAGDKNEAGDGMAEDDETNLRRRLARYYRERRQTLGIVDFFSLFVPPLPPNSNITPHFKSCAASELYLVDGFSQSFSGIDGIERYNQRLRIASALSRLVSRAALYVKAYALAKIVIRNGWHLRKGDDESSGETSASAPNVDTAEEKTISSSTPTSEESGPTLARMNKTRLAFDTNRQNWLHDSGVQNESYEPTVGKDLATLVSWGKSSPETPNIRSSVYQAYSLVAWHAFRLPDPSDHRANHWLRPDVDPVESIPSLRDVIEKYPNSHFIVFSHFRKGIAVFSLYVRTLPYGVDASFDKTMNRFIKCSSEERNSVLQCAWNLCPGHNWSSLTKRAARAFVISLCHVWMRGKVFLPFSLGKEGKSERLSFPCMLMSELAKCKHFGGEGCIQTRDGMPKNYISFSMHASVENAPSMITKILIQSMQSSRLGIFKSCIVDIQLVLRARIEDEYPERVLTALRFAHVDLNEVANPPDFSEHCPRNLICEAEEESVSRHDAEATGWLTRLFRFGREEKPAAVITSHANMSSTDQINELYSSSIDAMYSILDGITVSCPKKTTSSLNGSENIDTMPKRSVFVLDEVTRADIERYIIACDNDLRNTAVRMIESAAWRCATFPVDTRTCKIELSSGQFFQQGKDKEKNPVFYFRNLLPSIWRHDIDATVFAVLHRLESFLSQRPRTKVTVIILLSVQNSSDGIDTKKTSNKKKDHYHVHSNLQLVNRLTRILSRHYPERLSKALFVTSGGWAKTLIGSRGIKSYVQSPITRSRIHVLNSLEDLKRYVNQSELVSFAGGKADVNPSAYQQDINYITT